MPLKLDVKLQILTASFDPFDLTNPKSGVHHACARLEFLRALWRKGAQICRTFCGRRTPLRPWSSWKTIRAVAGGRRSPGGARDRFVSSEQSLRNLVEES